MITVEHVHKSFGAFKAVSDLSFSVPVGSVCGFLGPNGAGKTTTIRMLTGAIQPNAGRLVLAGADIRGDSRSARRQLGYLPETNPLPSELNVREYLKFRCALWGVDRMKRRAAIDGVIDRCGLAEVRNKLLGSLSRGFRQRVGLAAALVPSPSVVILDEPGTGLDPTTAMAFRTLVRSLRGQHTVLFSSHNLAEVEATCDHLVLIARGKLVAAGSAIDLRRQGAVGGRFEVESTRCDPVALREIVGVLGVQTESMQDGWTRIAIEVVADGESAMGVPAAVAAALHSVGAMIRRFERANPSLEEIFQRLVRGRENETGRESGGAQ